MGKKQTSLEKCDGLMEQIRREVILLADCVSKQLVPEAMVMIRVKKGRDGKAVIDVGIGADKASIKAIEKVRKEIEN